MEWPQWRELSCPGDPSFDPLDVWNTLQNYTSSATINKASTSNPGTRYPTFIFRNRFQNAGTENRQEYVYEVHVVN